MELFCDNYLLWNPNYECYKTYKLKSGHVKYNYAGNGFTWRLSREEEMERYN
jgi:hypothetical protein